MSIWLPPKKTIIVLLLLLLMTGGLYLAMGAVFSLSYIKDSPGEKQEVFQRFDTLFRVPPEQFYNERMKIKETSYQVNDIGENISKLRALRTCSEVINATPTIRRRIVTDADDAANFLEQKLAEINLQKALVTEQQEELRTQMTNVYEAAKSKFRSEASHLSSSLLAKYGEDLWMFVTNYRITATLTLNHNISEFNKRSTTLYRMTVYANKNAELVCITNGTHDSITLINPSLIPPEQPFVNIRDTIVRHAEAWPKSGVTGEEWGNVFVFLIRPIAQSKNVDVLLVCGMLGFGLLGAAIAIFITGTGQDNVLTSYNLVQVIVRGFSAAIVVYLALRGGVALISNNSGDPNPMALFLFCFIGAVFSDRIWGWARVRIADPFSVQRSTPDQQQNS